MPHHDITTVAAESQERISERIDMMSQTKKRGITLILVLLAGTVLGRLAVRAVMNLLLGGTLWGGNFL